MDNHTKEQRRKNEQAFKNKDSKIEQLLRKELWARGLHYHKNSKKYSESLILFLSVKRLPCFVTANFGMDTIGITRKMTFNLIENFGFPKLSEICSEILKLPHD